MYIHISTLKCVYEREREKYLVLMYTRVITCQNITNTICMIMVHVVVNTDVSKIKTVLKVCNVYESCSITDGPEISVRHPEQLSDADVT